MGVISEKAVINSVVKPLLSEALYAKIFIKPFCSKCDFCTINSTIFWPVPHFLHLFSIDRDEGNGHKR